MLARTVSNQTRFNRFVVNQHPQRFFQHQQQHKQKYLHAYIEKGYRFLQIQYCQRFPFQTFRSKCNKNSMGSINCKEYVTTANNDSCANQAGAGTSGSYHSTSEPTTMTSEYTDPVVVCNEADLNENEMKQLDFNENLKILLIKQNGRLTAIGNKCSHYGAPLHTGALGVGRVRCPWHGACFNIETGDIEDFPGLDSVPCYQVEVEEDGQVKVRVKRKDLECPKRLKDMVKRIEEDERVFVIVGGGPSAGVCAETLRQEGFTGRIIMLCKENTLPYDRVKVTKVMDIPIETLRFRTIEFYNDFAIEVMTGVEATKFEPSIKNVMCSTGKSLQYDKIYIATGSKAIKPPIPGADLGNVVTIRDHAEGAEIVKKLKKEMNVVCLGASFISLESACFLVSKVNSVTLVGRDNVPLKLVLGEAIGERIMKLYQDNGVVMVMNSGIEEIIGNKENNVTEVKLISGTKIPCDLLIMGTGARFNTDFLQDSGLAINEDGSIDTDMNLMTNIPDVYVGGDIACAPILPFANQRATVGHYQLAQYHGRVAAINMAGARVESLRAVPFFFTMLFGKSIRYAGYGKFNDVVIEGDLENLQFVAYFINDNQVVVAAASCNRDPIVSKFAELLSQGKRIHRCDVVGVEDPEEWTKYLYERALDSC